MSTPTTTKTGLLLLGLLLDRPRHGYELYRHIQAEGIDDWFNLSTAGVYYSLRKLREQGWVAESRQRNAGSSRKSIYRLTDKGRSAFFAVVEAELASKKRTRLDYDLAIYLLNRVPLQRAIPCLEKHRSFLAEQADKVRAALAAEWGNGAPPLRVAILDHRLRFLEMEQGWLADVISSIQEESRPDHARAEERQGLMVLGGDLRDFHLPDLIHLIVTGHHSGTLRITDGAEVRILVFEDGQPVGASDLRQDETTTAACSCDEVLDGLCELFRRREGRFTFDQSVGDWDWCVPLECSAEELILRGCRKVDSWAIIQRLVPSADTIFELGPASRGLDRLTLTPNEEQVIAEVDGVKNVATIANELDLTLFEASRVVYCLTAIGVLHTADLDKIRLRRVFGEIAELMCNSTVAWSLSPDDRVCEKEVNQQTVHLPICLDNGRIQDRADPQLETEELKEMYHRFLQEQFKVVSRHFGRVNARQSFEQTLRQLSPELQRVAKRYGFDRLARD